MSLSLEITAVASEHRWRRSSEDLLVSTSKARSYVMCACIKRGTPGHVGIHIFIYIYIDILLGYNLLVKMSVYNMNSMSWNLSGMCHQKFSEDFHKDNVTH